LKFFVCLVFPPLSLSALKEYRPSLTPNLLSASTIYTQKKHRNAMLKPDFIWEQSIVSPRHE
jgi:hypothetical protein